MKYWIFGQNVMIMIFGKFILPHLVNNLINTNNNCNTFEFSDIKLYKKFFKLRKSYVSRRLLEILDKFSKNSPKKLFFSRDFQF